MKFLLLMKVDLSPPFDFSFLHPLFLSSPVLFLLPYLSVLPVNKATRKRKRK
jgi:hypothetical protein